MDEWVDVSDDLPQIERGMQSVSINVTAKLENGATKRAFYCYRDREWYAENGKRLHGNIVAWQS